MKYSKTPLLFTLFVVFSILLSACGQAATPEASQPAETKADTSAEADAPTAEAESSEPTAETEAV
ncbi:MAG: hypothetical protein H6632_16225, partial [Anaerolineales bacterium]|nr:hypothetical protein [Anaerolineales bacterium]